MKLPFSKQIPLGVARPHGYGWYDYRPERNEMYIAPIPLHLLYGLCITVLLATMIGFTKLNYWLRRHLERQRKTYKR